MPQSGLERRQGAFAATRFYRRNDPTSLFLVRRGADGAVNHHRADGALPELFHRAGLGPCAGARHRHDARSGKAHGERRSAGHCLGEARDFARYHHVLSRARWNSAAISRKLLLLILDKFAPDGPIVIGIDDTIERRWGHKIAARGVYRDPVRSSHGHFVKTSGLRWLAVMAMVPVPWTRRRWALPFSPSSPLPNATPPRTASPQEADRLGSPSHTSGSPMGAQAQYRRCRRLQLLGA